MRYTATAFALNVTAAVFAGTGPYVSAWLVGRTGMAGSPAVYLAVVALVALATAVVGVPRRWPAGRSVASLPA